MHVFLEQATVFGVFFVEVQAVLFARQHARQLRRARIMTQHAIGVHGANHFQVIDQLIRYILGLPQPGDALQPLAGAAGLIALQVVQADAGMAVEVGEGRFLA
ncbi:hypothetical protein D3C86_1607920 [compost metagenome]